MVHPSVRVASAPLDSLVSYQGCSVGLRGTALWFDARTARDLSFVSHALHPGIRFHARILASSTTAELLQALLGAPRRKRRGPLILAVPPGQAFSLGELSLRLIPAGLFGASAMFVSWRGTTILFGGAGAVSCGGLTSSGQPPRCHVLVLDCAAHDAGEQSSLTARLRPLSAEHELEIVRQANETLASGLTPVVCCPPVGAAQQLAVGFLRQGLAVSAHPSIRAAAAVFAAHDYLVSQSDLSRLRRYDVRVGFDPIARPEVLLWPDRHPSAERFDSLPRARILRVARAEQRETRSSHAHLLAEIERCQPDHVVLAGDPPSTLVEALRERSLPLQVLRISKQLELPVGCD